VAQRQGSRKEIYDKSVLIQIVLSVFIFRGLFVWKGSTMAIYFLPVPTWKGDGCMKDTVHHMRHHRDHLGDQANAQGTRGCAWRDDQFGRGQNTVLGWSDPTFAHGSVPKVSRGSLQPSTENFTRVLPTCLSRFCTTNVKEEGE
jgi:hypothetical protein